MRLDVNHELMMLKVYCANSDYVYYQNLNFFYIQRVLIKYKIANEKEKDLFLLCCEKKKKFTYSLKRCTQLLRYKINVQISI